ncbi:ras GTPase-activating protein nGAP-like isoform X5 [Mercenaria mercenaria]|uniref:ras GTPase-activating protein nGAP-like isoform X5 n=1 Tax=Mercenaria mercenaria TaxID=6596 RepID=UPI00234EC7E1|nr:ras GTPase-activating protein nGAP-like isoform X5 [Mercenaria mercenaria]
MSFKKKRAIQFPSKIIGWLNIWDVHGDSIQRHLTDGRVPQPKFEPFFCVLRQDLKTLQCHRSEEETEDFPGLVRLPVVRLDEGKRQFDRRWGYETLECIKENSIQHFSMLSTERLYKAQQTDELYGSHLEVPCNESLPDLTRSYDSALFPPKRRHVLKKFFHTSYEKLVGEKETRRGSVPAVPAAVSEDCIKMETSTTTSATPSRFTSFLIRKGFKTNLKRAKSANKLDRKNRSVTPTPDSDSTFVGTLKRTMSLGRLSRKRTRSKSTDLVSHKLHSRDPEHLPCSCVTPTPASRSTWSVISSRLKNSQSHESLLTTHSPLHSIDLTSPDMEIRPLHRSILTEDHCFQVSTMHGSKYISCRTAEEREQWMTSLRRTVNPQHENSRRSESSLKVWVQEAKNVPSKKRYFCEVCLDKDLYARTSIKMKGDMLFWGEQFEFNNLPSVEFLIVNLYREADKKKKKDRNTLVGYSKIPVCDISNRQYVERWFATSSGTVGKGGKENKIDLPLIRLKVRHQTVQILPVDLYKDLSNYLKENYVQLCDSLEPLVSIKDKEEIAKTLVNIMQKLDKAQDFLSELVMTEVLRLDNNHLMFRGNSIATKSMEAHMKLVGEKYLNDTLGDFVRTIIESEDDCEVDPTRVPIPSMLTRHQANLRMYCDMAWTKIITSSSFFPSELRNVFTRFRGCCEQEGKGDLSDNLISASIFLRFLCPAILSPSLFHLTQEYPSEKAARNLTLIAKTIQTLANLSKFGGKEEYMTFMNDFVEEEWCNMKDFLHKISSADPNDNYTEYDGFIDLGKEMSILHTLLIDTLEKGSEETTSKLGTLPKVLSQITNDLKDPDITQRRQSNRKSQHYDNLVNIQAHIDHTTSPTELLKDMLRHCGESPNQLPIFSSNNKDSDSPRGSVDNITSSDSNLTEDSVSSKVEFTSSEVSNVSVSSRSTVNESHVNKSWNQMVSAAEIVNGDYIDLISFMDEEGNNSSIEIEQNGSQMSISQVSTIASSGYQSFGYSQSSSPVDNAHHDNNHEPLKSPNNNSSYTHSTPLSFANPMYRRNHRGITSHVKMASPILQASSNSSLSSEEANTVKNCSPVKTKKYEKECTEIPIKNMALQLSSSSSLDSVPDRDKMHHSLSSSNMYSSVSSAETRRVPTHSKSNNNVYSLNVEVNTKPRHSRSNNNVSARSKETTFSSTVHTSNTRKYPLELRTSSPTLSQSVSGSSNSVTNSTTYYNTIGSTPRRGHELSHSMDFSYTTHRYGDQIRRTATDTSLSQRSSSPYSDTSVASSPVSPRSQLSPDDSSLLRRLSAQNAVHMGIRSVQRRIHEQEKTKQEYETEVNVLKQQLEEAQERLKMAEERLHDHEKETSMIASEWQIRLEESEERMRKQQAEKDDQMKNIIQSKKKHLLKFSIQKPVRTKLATDGD